MNEAIVYVFNLCVQVAKPNEVILEQGVKNETQKFLILLVAQRFKSGYSIVIHEWETDAAKTKNPITVEI